MMVELIDLSDGFVRNFSIPCQLDMRTVGDVRFNGVGRLDVRTVGDACPYGVGWLDVRTVEDACPYNAREEASFDVC